MRIIKVDAIDSTNSFIRQRMPDFPSENICAVTKFQLAGRGQMGTNWQSEMGKNLTFSILLRNLQLPAQQQFKISAVVSLCLLNILRDLKIENVSIKWPNDILAGNKKVAGILIENMLKGEHINATIIGVGLNVNQKAFIGLPNAISLKMLSGKTYDLESILEDVLSKFENILDQLHHFSEEEIFQKYHENLFRIHQETMFELPGGNKFSGRIQGINSHGKLLVLNKNQELKSFQLKEVKMLY